MSIRPRPVVALFVAALAALALLAPASGASASGGAASDASVVADASSASSLHGSLQGEITLGPRLTARRMRFNAYPDAQAAIAAKPAHAESSRSEEFANVVVYLETVGGADLRAASKGRNRGRDGESAAARDTEAGSGSPATRVSAPRPAPSSALAVRQEGLSFTPHVLPVLKGSTVEFPNADTVFHNVFSLSHVSTFDLGRYPRGESKAVRFDTPGLVKVFCHIHSDMSAVVLVLDNPYFVVPDAAGRFRIEGIPPGEYRAVAWHERARRVSQPVRITPGGTATADFQIPLEDPVE